MVPRAARDCIEVTVRLRCGLSTKSGSMWEQSFKSKDKTQNKGLWGCLQLRTALIAIVDCMYTAI